MNVLFLSLTTFDSLNQRNIYTDLLREFVKNGHEVFSVCPIQKRENKPTTLINEGNTHILRVRTGNMTQVGFIEKGISTVLISSQFISAIKKYFAEVKFDILLYPTPPITLESVVRYFKKRDHAKTYLMLKDIFPQNAVDLRIMTKTGVKGLIYKYFRAKEKNLYAISDRIGCMSQANVDYVIKYNPEVDPNKVEICPNCIEVQDMTITAEERIALRKKYGIPQNKKVFVYGGNLGKPQGVPFIIECLKKMNGHPEAYFLIVGSGTEFGKFQAFFDDVKPENMKLLNYLPKEDYDKIVAACDVGLIFLDHRFTIPNFPSRLLGYMQAGLPVLAATDPNTDIGKVITEGGFGWWCESNDVEAFVSKCEQALKTSLSSMKKLESKYLRDYYTVQYGYAIIKRGI